MFPSIIRALRGEIYDDHPVHARRDPARRLLPGAGSALPRPALDGPPPAPAERAADAGGPALLALARPAPAPARGGAARADRPGRATGPRPREPPAPGGVRAQRGAP